MTFLKRQKVPPKGGPGPQKPLFWSGLNWPKRIWGAQRAQEGSTRGQKRGQKHENGDFDEKVKQKSIFYDNFDQNAPMEMELDQVFRI